MKTLTWTDSDDIGLSLLKADAIAAEILKRCTGEATLDAIVDGLAASFNAPRERIHADVTKILGGLAEKKLLEL